MPKHWFSKKHRNNQAVKLGVDLIDPEYRGYKFAIADSIQWNI